MTDPFLNPSEYVKTLRSFEEPSGQQTQHEGMPEEEYVEAQLMLAVSSLELLGAASQALWTACGDLLDGKETGYDPPDVPTVVSAVAGALESMLPVALEGMELPGGSDAVE
tara:strand:+ start:323 stop:655 length:333 start_codon:yes stop_codon:yes gene_type:complete